MIEKRFLAGGEILIERLALTGNSTKNNLDKTNLFSSITPHSSSDKILTILEKTAFENFRGLKK